MSQIKVITPRKAFTPINWRELYNYRSLIFQFANRDFKVRYVQTYLGGLWAIVNPVISVLLLSFVFGNIAKVDTMGIPHLLFSMSGLFIWNYFSTMVSEAGSTIIGAQNMVKKVYFPKIILPLYKSITALIEMGIAIALLLALFAYFETWPSAKIVYLPLVIMATMLVSMGLALLSAAIVIQFRDFHHVLPHLVRFGLYVCPVAYPASLASKSSYQMLFYCNPITGLIEAARWTLFSNYPWSDYNYLSGVTGVFLLLIGIFYFSSIEGDIADSI
jgi:lipopolysaccharide transport system permease protein